MAIDLVDIAAGIGGFVIYGEQAEDESGRSVSSAGDVNGDGFDDLVIGAPSADGPADGRDSAGDSYVVFGQAAGFGAIDLAAITAGDGSQGFVIHGEDAGDGSGFSVSSAGDVNGDGFDDLIIGAPYADGPADGRSSAGDSYVVFGQADGFGAALDLAATAGDGSQGFVLQGEDLSDRSGRSVSSAGDVNGDGFDDLIVGAFYPADAGGSYVVFGQAGGFGATLDLAAITAGDGTQGFVILGEDALDYAGLSVSSAGDVNGDGFDDIVIGAPTADGSADGSADAGDSYVVFGQAGGFGATLDLAAISAGDGTQGFVIHGEDTSDTAGFSVSSAGDVNGDGFDDLVIGARSADGPADGNLDAGDSYVVFGQASGFGATLDLAAITAGDGTQGFVIHGEDANDRSGSSVSSAGDVNGDGFDDLIIGAPYGDGPAEGRFSAGDSYVVFGQADGFGASIDLADIAAGNGGFVIHGEQAFDQSGFSVSAAGDINGDGFDDLVVGARLADGPADSRDGAGDSYVIFGSDTIDGSVSPLTQPAGGDGDDFLFGDPLVDDVLVGGGGNDELLAEGGADSLRGGEGDDVFTLLDAGFRRVSGGTGFDIFFLDGEMTVTDADFRRVDGIETILLCDEVVNLTLGANAAHAMDGLAFDDFRITVDGMFGMAAHVIDGSALDRPLFVNMIDNAGGVTVIGGSAADDFQGGAGADRFAGGAGADTLRGDIGNDWLNGGAGADSLDGGTDTDFAAYSTATAGVVASLLAPAGNTGDAAGDSYTGIENLAGTNFADTLAGDDSGNALYGNGDVDTLTGNGGNDTLNGGAGADSLDGGGGTDLASYSTAAAGVVASLLTPGGNTGDAAGDSYAGIESLAGTSFVDTLAGDDNSNALYAYGGADTLTGNGGNDTLNGGAGADSLNGGTGFDFASYSLATAGVSASLLAPAGNTGDAAGDTYTGIENLQGSNFDDTLAGNSGGNVVAGLAGVDTLAGNAGNDVLNGGAGADTFVFGDGDGQDTVRDFEDGLDSFDLTGVAGVDAFADLELIDNGATVTVDYDTGTFTLTNVEDSATIDASDFIFV